MAKKKTKTKTKSKPPARYRGKKTNGATTWKGSDARRAAARTPKGPRSQALPGMAQVRDARLDSICESIGEGLDQINAGTQTVDDGKSAAGQRLKAKGLQSYRHAGVRVTVIPGADKISVKREKDREINVAVTAGEAVQTTEPGATEDVDGDLAGEADLT